MSAAAAVAGLGQGCSKPAPPAVDGGTAVVAFAGEGAHLNPAARCGRCHTRQRSEWAASTHAQSGAGAFMRALSLAGSDAARCRACHVPLASVERVAPEGVSCDACHTAVAASSGPSAVQLVPERGIKYGPFRDAQDHDFHRVAYSDFVTGTALCAACHEDRAPGGFPIYSTVSEWKSSPFAAVDCQGCHLPTTRGIAAKGGPPRDVSAHDFGGLHRVEDLARGVLLDAALAPGSPPHLTVRIHNAAVGHDVPTGAPERRLILQVEWRRHGAVARTDERRYGRVVVNASGQVDLSARAVKLASDNRIHAGEIRTEELIGPAGADEVRVSLIHARWDSALEPLLGPAPQVRFAEKQLAAR